jgi:hypothetical protein
MIAATMVARVRAFRPSYSMVLVTSAVLTVVALFGARAYFQEYGSVASRTLLSSGGVDAQLFRARAKERLSVGPMPIERAMQTIATTGRNLPMIEPRRSTDPAPAAGWMHHPGYEAPPVVEEAPEPEPEPEPEEATEAMPGNSLGADIPEAPTTTVGLGGPPVAPAMAPVVEASP